MQNVIDKARILVEALPYINRFRGSTMVIKMGGATLEDEGLRQRFAEDITLLDSVGIHVLAVHGGGKQISEMLTRLGLSPKFVDGKRVTDMETLKVVEMVLSGDLNKELVRLVQRCGGRAIGITGKDGGLAKARQIPELGFVGEVSHIDTSVIERLKSQFVPIIAPLATSEDFETLNVNADTFASSLAGAVRAEKLMLLTDVEGVQDQAGEVISTLAAQDAADMIASGVIHGGMIPKVEYAIAALKAGVNKVHIVDGRVEHALLLEIFTSEGIGTQIVP